MNIGWWRRFPISYSGSSGSSSTDHCIVTGAMSYHPVQALCAFFAAMSVITSYTVLVDPCAGFKLFGVRLARPASADAGSDTTLATTLYASAVAGALQLAARR